MAPIFNDPTRGFGTVKLILLPPRLNIRQPLNRLEGIELNFHHQISIAAAAAVVNTRQFLMMIIIILSSSSSSSSLRMFVAYSSV